MMDPHSTQLSSDDDSKASEQPFQKILNITRREHLVQPVLKTASKVLRSASVFVGVLCLLATSLHNLLSNYSDATTSSSIYFTGILGLCAISFAIWTTGWRQFCQLRKETYHITGVGAADYFSTSPRENDPFNLFSSGYEHFLKWVMNAHHPILFLTGQSGAGKSSLIQAFLRPRLEGPQLESRTSVVVLRSYANPLCELKRALFKELGKDAPKNINSLSAIDVIERVSRQCRDKKILIVFDQFEEFFLTRFANNGDDIATKTFQGDDAPKFHSDVRCFGDFLSDLQSRSLANVRVLLSYRDDYQHFLNEWDLPNRVEHINWMTVLPLFFAKARKFLESCPDLNIPPAQIELALEEANREESDPLLVRPIIVNLLGKILQNKSEHPTRGESTEGLLESYIHDSLYADGEVSELRCKLLDSLLTGFDTARPCSIQQLSKHLRLKPKQIEIQLLQLTTKGIVRRLNPDHPIDSQIWQISHDFIASLIRKVLKRISLSRQQMTRRQVAAACLVIIVFGFVGWPEIARLRAISVINRAGCVWNPITSTLIAEAPASDALDDLEQIIPTIATLRPLHIKFKECGALTNLDGIERLKTVKSIALDHCSAISDFNSLRNIPSLEHLTIIGCHELEEIPGLGTLSSLETLTIVGSPKLTYLEFPTTLEHLKSIRVGGCSELTKVVLRRLPSLQELDLSGCGRLSQLQGLIEVLSLRTLGLNSCKSLKSIDGLPFLTSLEILKIRGCVAIRVLEGLEKLTSLQVVYLAGCKQLSNFDSLFELESLNDLDLSYCKTPSEIDLSKLTSLQSLKLRGCDMLRNLIGVGELPYFKSLDLRGCKLSANTLPDHQTIQILR